MRVAGPKVLSSEPTRRLSLQFQIKPAKVPALISLVTADIAIASGTRAGSATSFEHACHTQVYLSYLLHV